ncbi:MAG: cell wall hydrolase [Gammaproteobacteria bacterium]|nr:cell wall hydrolase [Gammaproteobacteria bacterium]
MYRYVDQAVLVPMITGLINQNPFRFVLGVALSICFMALANTGVADRPSSPIYHESYGTGMSNELRCLALNIYHEARGESISGQKAIASVIMNRVRSQRYPDSICEVVWQPKQFSWTIAHEKYHAVTDPRAWKVALIIAQRTLAGYEYARVGEATHYHASSVAPYWAAYGNFVVKIGDHIFYEMDA